MLLNLPIIVFMLSHRLLSHRSKLYGLALVLALSGCASVPNQPSSSQATHTQSTSNQQATPKPAETAPKVSDAQPLAKHTLLDLLTAEIAGQRGQFDTAANLYLKQAHSTQHPDIAKRAANIAQYMNHEAHLDESIKLWVTLAPNDATAQRSAANLAMHQGNYKQAMTHIERVFELTGDGRLDHLIQPVIAQNTSLDTLTTLLHNYQQRRPKDSSALVALSLLQLARNEPKASLLSINKALDAGFKRINGQLHKARVLVALKQVPQAIRWLDDVSQQHPQNKRALLFKARLHLKQEQLTKAQHAFKTLHERHPNDGEVLLSLAIIEDERLDTEAARAHFKSLLTHPTLASTASFYLSRLALERGDLDAAMHHGLNVKPSMRDFLFIQVRVFEAVLDARGQQQALAYLDILGNTHALTPTSSIDMARLHITAHFGLSHWQQASELANQALEQYPDHIELLYLRAMLADKQNNLPALERDLRRVLAQNPKHVDALNALGYALANSTQRYQEALELVQKAIDLRPDSAAIIDSLGWVHYHLGNLDTAASLLQRAFSLMPDHEVAAHLGEVLWQQGKYSRAKQAWKAGLENTPDSLIIKNTLKRFNISDL